MIKLTKKQKRALLDQLSDAITTVLDDVLGDGEDEHVDVEDDEDIETLKDEMHDALYNAALLTLENNAKALQEIDDACPTV